MPFDPSRYPANWKTEIVPRIKERDGHCCKFCGIQDGLIGWRFKSGNFYTQKQIDADIRKAEHEPDLWQVLRKPAFKIILTVAHLDHKLVNHEDDNLAALCQRCHLNYDRASCDAARQAAKKYGAKHDSPTYQFSLFDEHALQESAG